jgi:hypothetical protein
MCLGKSCQRAPSAQSTTSLSKRDDGDECGTTLRRGVGSRNKGALFPLLVICEFWVSLAIFLLLAIANHTLKGQQKQGKL